MCTCVVRAVKIILSIFRNFANGMNMQQVISDIFAAEVSQIQNDNVRFKIGKF